MLWYAIYHAGAGGRQSGPPAGEVVGHQATTVGTEEGEEDVTEILQEAYRTCLQGGER